jgi:hypothetical protein
VQEGRPRSPLFITRYLTNKKQTITGGTDEV